MVRMSDSHVWNKCNLKFYLNSNNFPLPQPSPLSGCDNNFPYVLVGDEIFPLTTNLLIPFLKYQCRNRLDRRIFNYRLSRAAVQKMHLAYWVHDFKFFEQL